MRAEQQKGTFIDSTTDDHDVIVGALENGCVPKALEQIEQEVSGANICVSFSDVVSEERPAYPQRRSFFH